MKRGQDAAERRTQLQQHQREMMLQTLAPEGMDSIPSAQFDLLSDTMACSQWPTLPLSPTSRNQLRGASCSFLDGSPTRSAMRCHNETLETLPCGASHRLHGPADSEFDLLGASEMMPATETPLLEPAIEHAADAYPTTMQPILSYHHRKAHEPVRTHSITLPQPPERPGNPCADTSMQFSPSPASSLLLSSGGGTDACTATQYACSAESRSKCDPSPSPQKQFLVVTPVATHVARSPPRPVSPPAGHSTQPPEGSHRQSPAQGAATLATPPASSWESTGRGGADIHRSPVSDATIVSESSQSSPPWMSSGVRAPAHPLGILSPQRDGPPPLASASMMDGGESSMNFQSCISSTISSSMMSMDENSGKAQGAQLAHPLARHRKAFSAVALAAQAPSSLLQDVTEESAAASIPGASTNQAWSNPIFSSHSTTSDGVDSEPSHAASSGPVSSYRGDDAAEAAENDPNPPNNPSRLQSQALESQLLESDQEPAPADSEVFPEAICCILDKIDDIEKRISCGWQEEQALRAHEEASLDHVASKKQRVILPEHSGFTPTVTPSPSPSWPQQDSHREADAGTASMSQAGDALSGRDDAWSHAGGPESLSASSEPPLTPRNWEERALELQEELAAAHLHAQQQREALQAQLQEVQALLRQERLLRSHALAPPVASSSSGSMHEADPRSKPSARGALDTAATADDASALVTEAQGSVKRLEEVVATRLEPLVCQIAAMQSRMVSAQHEACVLRAQLLDTEPRMHALQKDLEEAQAQAAEADAPLPAAPPPARVQPPLRGGSTGAPSPRTPRAHGSAEDMSVLLRQLQAANAENSELKGAVSKLQERQAGLQGLLADRRSGTGTVPLSDHEKVVLQNKQLQAQLQQMRMDLELLYMDDQLATAANDGTSMSMGLGVTADGLSGPTPTSFMSTVHRLGALLGVSEPQRPQATVRRSSMSTLPQLSENENWSPPGAPLQPHHGPAWLNAAQAATEEDSKSRDGQHPAAACAEEVLHTDLEVECVLAGGARPRYPVGGQEHGSPGSLPCSPRACAAVQDSSMMDGPANPGGSVMSMFRTLDQGARATLREHTADRLAATVQNQAGAIVEKDQHIAKLLARVRALEAAQPQQNGTGACESGSMHAAQESERHSWDSLPPPESFKEALEQILLLQVENGRLAAELAARATSAGASAALGDAGSRRVPPAPEIKEDSGRQRKDATLMRTVTQALKAMPSMTGGAVAVANVEGARGSAPGPCGVTDGTGADTSVDGAEFMVFKDMVTRALSDQVVAWQDAHDEVSRELVTANLRVAEDAMLIEQLKAEHERLKVQFKELSMAHAPPPPSTPGKSSSSGKGGRLSFLGRLTTPRHT